MDFSALIEEVTAAFGRNLRDVVRVVQVDDLTPASFEHLVGSLKAAVNEAGLNALTGIVGEFEEAAEVIRRDDRRLRFKQACEKEWLTPFGVATVARRYYQADAGGEGVYPLDERTGMVGRFMTPDVEELVALASSNLVPKEVAELLGKALPHGPSATAVQRVIRDVGRFAEAHDAAIEDFINTEAPLSEEGDICAISWDGVNVPLREEGAKCGRPAERPGVRETNRSPTAWKEASVGCISIYATSNDPDEAPERLDKRYFARMPQPGMAFLLEQQQRAVRALLESRSRPFRKIAILCDGKRSIWDAVRRSPLYADIDVTAILDFYHATEHLSRASEALFGKKSDEGASWYDRYRGRMLDEDNGVDSAIRSMRYYRRTLRRGSERYALVSRVMKFFRRNIERMRYAAFIREGLPIGSGPVEAACKTLVGARLKRSGMRWTREGGQNILNLRRHEKASRWDPFWRFYIENRCKAA